MSDLAVGIAVLVPNAEEGGMCGRLYFIAQYGDGKGPWGKPTFIEDIPVATAEQIKGGPVGWGQGKGPWTMRKEGDMLHVCPSVNDITSKWHNAYQWSIKFVVFDMDTINKDFGSSERCLREINPDFPFQ